MKVVENQNQTNHLSASLIDREAFSLALRLAEFRIGNKTGYCILLSKRIV